MNKKPVSAIMLALILTSMLTLVFSNQLVKAESEVIIDTEVGESRFTPYPPRQSPNYWIHVQNHDVFYTRAYGDNFWYTLCGADGTGEPLYYGLWQASLSSSGLYEVFVWIPNPDAFVYDGRTYTPTQSAIYQIYHRDGMAVQTVNQRMRTGGWYSLGSYTFGSSASVILNDRTGEPYLSTMLAFDAIKFVGAEEINNPPYEPYNPSPYNHEEGVLVTTDLSWNGGDPDADTVTYDVYFGLGSSPPLVSSGQSTTIYSPVTLSYAKKYYWKIVARDSHGASTQGPVWDFTTPAEALSISINADGSITPTTAPIQRYGDVYTFTDNINGSIAVQKSNIIIDGAGYALRGRSLEGESGFYLRYVKNVTIKDANIRGFDGLYCAGIVLGDSSGNTFLRNNVESCYQGITFENSFNNILRENHMIDNRYGFCLNVGGWIEIGDSTYYVNDVDSTNLIDNKPIYYWVGKSNAHVPIDAGHVVLVGCTNITVEGLELSRTGGMLIFGTRNSLVANNDITDIQEGVAIRCSHNNLLLNNRIAGARGLGIFMIFSENNTLSGNRIRDSRAGIELDWSNRNLLCNNAITNNAGQSILLGGSNNDISGNDIASNGYGISCIGDSNGYVTSTENRIHGNNISNNNFGVYVYCYSSGNWFYHNNFIGNTEQYHCELWGTSTPPSINAWDDGYPSGGNYWSDYTDLDLDNDGIWDHSRIVDENNQDHYPLVNPRTGPSADCGKPVLISAMKISRIGDTLTAEFEIQNLGSASIRLDKLLVGGRFNWGTLTSGDFPDFPSESVTLAPNESHEYTGTMELTEVGNYQFFVAYYIEDPSEQERKLLDQDNWNTCIDLAEGLTDKDRSISLEKWPAIVISSPLRISPPSGPYYAGDLLIARFSLRNVGSIPVTLDTLTVGGRDPDGLTIDFDWNYHVTISPQGEPDDEYTYIGVRRLPEKKGDYHFFCAYQATDGSWNTCIDLSEGLMDTDRVKDINVFEAEPKYPLGGIVIPEADFPEGKGNVIPIYVPTVIDGSNVIREENGWQTVRTLAKADWSFDWQMFKAGLFAVGSAHWDPTVGQYVMEPTDKILDIIGSYFLAFGGAQSIAQICITIQRNSQWDYRAILQVSDPEARSLFRTYADQGMYSFVPGELPVNVEDALSDGIADYFKLPAAKFSETYLETLYIDKAHKNEEYNGYLSLSKDNRIELTPKIFKGDALGIELWKEHFIIPPFPTSREVLRLKGQAFVDFEKCRATDAESKLIQQALAPISLVPESAIILSGGSPCEFRIRDSQGRVTGLVNGEAREEIPHSMYLSESETIIIYEPSEDLEYEVVGEYAGTYALHITSVKGWNVTTFIASNIPTDSQAVHNYAFDWVALSQGEGGATVQVDSDGDATFEYAFTVDNTLTPGEFLARTLPDMNGDGIVGIEDIVFVSGKYGSRVGDPIWDSKADLAAAYGKIDIFDLVTLAAHYGEKAP